MPEPEILNPPSPVCKEFNLAEINIGDANGMDYNNAIINIHPDNNGQPDLNTIVTDMNITTTGTSTYWYVVNIDDCIGQVSVDIPILPQPVLAPFPDDFHTCLGIDISRILPTDINGLDLENDADISYHPDNNGQPGLNNPLSDLFINQTGTMDPCRYGWLYGRCTI